MKKSLWTAVATLVICGAMSLPVLAQAGGGGGGGGGGGAAAGGGGGGGGGRGRGNFDPAAFMQRRLDNIRQQLNVTDDTEWKVLSDKIQKVLTVQQQMNTNRFGGRGGRGRGGPGGQDTGGPGAGGPPVDQTNPVAVAAAELSTAVQNNASPEELKTKMTALRTARAAKQTELQAAQKDLQGVVTPRQEAVLVEQNILE